MIRALSIINQARSNKRARILLYLQMTDNTACRKLNIRTMKRIAFMMTMFLLMLAGSAAAQEQELTKAEKKALQERIDSLQYAEAVQALNDRAFTLEADQVLFKYGQMAYVNSNTNFVSVKDNHAVVQVAFNIPISGPNGLGGVTVEGTFTEYDLKKDKKGNVSLSINVLGTGISARVDITLYKAGNKATVYITPNFNSNRMTLNGVIVPLQKSSVFKGRSI